jgi:pullulanase-type alpha-1,6-glucosidase
MLQDGFRPSTVSRMRGLVTLQRPHRSLIAALAALLIAPLLVGSAPPAGPSPAAAVSAGRALPPGAVVVTRDANGRPQLVRSALSVRSEAGDRDLARDSLRRDLTRERFYFVMTDRFANGDPTNDTGGLSGSRLRTGFDPTDKGFYQGGDLAGLIARLDYIKGLGTTALWLTPQFLNRPVQGEGANASAGYHGYWITDFTRVDPHLGTNADMKRLVREAHRRGLKVFFDIITNHTADVIAHAEGTYGYRSKAAYPYLDASGRPFDDRAYAGGRSFPAMTTDSFPYTPVFPTDADRTVKKPAWLNDRTLYHNRGDSTFAGESSEYGDFFGLDDLFTERPEVVDGMVDIYRTWVRETGIDGFRIDTVKHVNLEFWQRFVPELEGYAARVGNDDFFMFGEVFSGDPAFTSTYTTAGRLPAVLDFPFQEAARGFAGQGSPQRLRDLYAADDRYLDADSNAYALPTFLGNHDMGRIGGFVGRDNPGAGDAELVARDLLAHALMYTTRGQPVVYYGDEQGFTGPGGDKDARQTLFASRTADYLDDDLLGTDATHATDSYDRDSALYRGIARLAALRAAHPTLADGAQIQRHADTGPGVFAVSRIDARRQVEYIVALNNATTSRTVSVPTYGGAFTPIYPAAGADVTAGADGRVALTVPALATVVLKARHRAVPPATAPAVAVTAPAPDAAIRGLAEISADVPGDGFAQVTFAAKVGNAPWRVLGTDDNRPFRVYHDLTGVPADTIVAYKAIVKDAAGRVASARSDAVVDEEPPPTDPGVARRDWLVLHYQRPDGDYSGWGVHVWGDVETPTDWAAPLPLAGEDAYGRFAWVKLKPGASQVGYIVHKGDQKDCEADRFAEVARTGELWLRSGTCDAVTSRAQAQGYATVHYHRSDGQYGGWGLHLWGDAIADGVGTTWEAPRLPDGTDDYGAVWRIPLKNAGAPLNFIVHSGDTKDPGPDQSFIPQAQPAGFVMSGVNAVHASRAAAQNSAVLHYHRPDGDYAGWGLHVWTGAATPTEWTAPLLPVGRDGFGLVFRVPLAEGAQSLNYIVHRGDEKDLPADQSLDLRANGHEVWLLAATEGYLLPMSGAVGPDADLTKARAIWIDPTTVAWPGRPAAGMTYEVLSAADGSITVDDRGRLGGDYRVIRLSVADGGLTPAQRARFPHLVNYTALRVDPRDAGRVAEATRGQVVAVERRSDGLVVTATAVQLAGVLDTLYAGAAAGTRLGPVWRDGWPTVAVWAPTAQRVALELYADARPGTAPVLVPMRRDDASGVWSVTGPGSWRGRYYTFRVTVYAPAGGGVVTNSVIDPYAVSVSADSTRALLADPADPALAPTGWSSLRKPPAVSQHAASVYELHVRDFSASDPTVPAGQRGTYGAFTRPAAAGLRHLTDLADAGLTHVQLLPVQDFASVPERRADRTEPSCGLASMPPDSPDQQACVGAGRAADSFNWGYDPTGAYSVPEGSYASDPDGGARVRELRGAVAGLNRAGLRVVLDVVYNHTHASGQDPGSVLDRIVPGYYHRLLPDGTVATSTCCANTAPEHAMMGRLVVDSVVTWARRYKVDGFRFDLMGHHPKANLVEVRRALDALTLARDGVDGRSILLYGEGWNFGEVADNARFVQATQTEMAGTGIGTFNDRLRDAVRGGGPFDADPRVQGLASGLGTADNGAPANGDAAARAARLDRYHDLVKVGLAGNLADFSFTGADGATRTGRQTDYNGSPGGYTAVPADAVTYVDAHDNETLFDALTYKLRADTAMADRVRSQNLALAAALLGQGTAFVHAGSEQLRSKSLDRNSYDSGDWFNRLLWDCTAGNGFGGGLPPAWDNESKWPFAGPLLADPALRADCAAITGARARFAELLRIRASTPLFSLGDPDRIGAWVSFPSTGDGRDAAGVLAMRLRDGGDVDPRWASVTVLFNARPQAYSVTLDGLAGTTLHPVQADGVDPSVRAVRVDADGSVTIPARSVVVLVAPQ